MLDVPMNVTPRHFPCRSIEVFNSTPRHGNGETTLARLRFLDEKYRYAQLHFLQVNHDAGACAENSGQNTAAFEAIGHFGSVGFDCVSCTGLGHRTQVRLGGAEAGNGPTAIELVAQDGFAAGDEIFISYSSGQALTPDETLQHYSFVEVDNGLQSTRPGPSLDAKLQICTS